MNDHVERARELFCQGYNCAQAVLCAFGDVTGLDRDAAARLASSFGGGLGRLREVCGAVSGAAIVLGIARGYDDPTDPEAKKNHYRLIQDFAERFTEANGSIICRELLSGVEATIGGAPEARTETYYAARPCPNLVASAIAAEDARFCSHSGFDMKAIEKALQSFGYIILQEHMETCMVEDIRDGHTDVVGEVVELIRKLK